MRKWGPFLGLVAFLAILSGYALFCEAPIERHTEVSSEAVESIALMILGDPPTVGAPAERVGSYDETIISDLGWEAVDFSLNDEPFPDRFGEVAGELALSAKSGFELPVTDPLRDARISVAHIRARVVAGDRDAVSYAVVLLEDSANRIAQATTVPDWMSAQSERLLILEGLSASLKNDRWSEDDRSSLANSAQLAGHRAGLGQVLHLRFVNDILTTIAKSSEETRAAKIASTALYDQPTEEETELISALLHRHPKAYNPTETVEAGAESLRQLKAAMKTSWAETQAVLDQVTEVQSPWLQLENVLAMSDTEAIIEIKNFKLKLDTIENPVGLALLHKERLSWSNLVQSAFVADSMETQFFADLLEGTGTSIELSGVMDPLTGDLWNPSSLNHQEALALVGDDYPFFKAYIEQRLAQ